MEERKYRDGSISYREKIIIDGVEIKSPGFKRKTDAKNWRACKIAERSKAQANGTLHLLKRNDNFKEFAERFLEEKVKHQLARKTHIIYKNTLDNHIYPLVEHLKLKEISLAHGDKLVGILRGKGHNAKGINNILGVFKRVMSEAERKDYIGSNPLKRLKSVREQPRQDIFLSKDEIKQFLQINANNPLCPLYIVALNSGMRKGELGGLCWDRIDFDRRTLEITRSRDQFGTNETTKTSTKRVVPMNNEVRIVLEKLSKNKLKSAHVFLDKSGQPFDIHHLYREFREAQKRAGFTRFIRFHDLRHTFASHFMMNKGNLYDLQKILGHSKLDMTTKYAHLAPEHLAIAMNIVSFPAHSDCLPEEF